MNEKQKQLVLTWSAFVGGIAALTAVNYLATYSHPAFSPIDKNAMRLMIGAVILIVIGVALSLRLKPTFAHLWRYAIVGPLNMAIPQALILVAASEAYGAKSLDIGIAEAAIPGVILIYMFAGNRRFSWASTASVAVIAVGFALFSGINKGIDNPSWKVWGLLLGSAVCTGLGLVIDDKMNWPVEALVNGSEFQTKITKSLRKALFSAAISSVMCFGFVMASQAIGGREQMSIPPTSQQWFIVVGLAVAGTCISWISIFWLIQQGQLTLTAAAVAAVPVVTAIFDFIRGGQAHHTAIEWLGAALVIAAIFALVYLQLIKRRTTTIQLIEPQATAS